MKSRFDQETIHIAKHLLKHSLSSNEIKKNSNNKVSLLVIALLGFSGEEAVKVLFHKDIGLKGLGIIRLIFYILCLLSLGAYELDLYYNSDVADLDQPSKPLFGGIVLIAFASLIAVRSVIHYRLALRLNNRSSHTGDPQLLSFLLKGNWDVSLVNYLAEPLLLMSLGIGIYFIDWIAGLAVIACSVSVWLSYFTRYFLFADTIEQSISKMKEQQQRPVNKVSR